MRGAPLLFEEGPMAPTNPQGVYLRETATLRHRERFVKRMPPHMSLGFCKQDAAARTQGVVNFREESSAMSTS